MYPFLGICFVRLLFYIALASRVQEKRCSEYFQYTNIVLLKYLFDLYSLNVLILIVYLSVRLYDNNGLNTDISEIPYPVRNSELVWKWRSCAGTCSSHLVLSQEYIVTFMDSLLLFKQPLGYVQ